jgi:hypothetical protein
MGRYFNGKRVAISYANWPTASIFNLMGSLSDGAKYKPESWLEADGPTKVARALYYMGSSFTNTSALSQMAETLGVSRGSEDQFDASMRRWPKILGGFVGGYIPRALKDLDSWMQPEINNYKGWESVGKEIPFVRRAIGSEYLDVFGNPVKVDKAPWSRIYKPGADEPEYNLLGRLATHGIWFSPPNPQGKLIGKGSNRREMTPEEGLRYQKLVGKAYRDIVMRYGHRMLQMPVERAQKLAAQKTDDARDMATKQVARR